MAGHEYPAKRIHERGKMPQTAMVSTLEASNETIFTHAQLPAAIVRGENWGCQRATVLIWSALDVVDNTARAYQND